MNKKLIVLALFIITIPCACILGTYYICGKGGDISFYDNQELKIYPEHVDKQKNIYIHFVNAVAGYTAIQKFQDEFSSIKSKDIWQKENLQKIIKSFDENKIWEKNKDIITKIYKALEYKHYVFPDEMRYDTQLPLLHPIKEICELMCYKAIILFQEEKQDQALEMLAKVIKIGTLTQSAPAMICYMVGQVIITQGLEAIKYLLPSIHSAEYLQKIQQTISIIPEIQGAWKRTLKGEFSAFCHAMDTPGVVFDKGDLKEKLLRIFLFQPNKTKRIAADYFNDQIKNSEKNWQTIQKNTPNMESLRGHVINRYGWEIFLFVAPPQINHKKIILEVKITQISIALRMYQLKNGVLPEDLDALVGQYLDAVPVDDFDGTPMKYSLPEKKVFSAWQDGSPNNAVVYNINF